MTIHPSARIAERVNIGEGAIIGPDVEIGSDSVIEPYAILGYRNGRERGGLVIGPRARVRSHSIIYAGSIIGGDLVTGHYAVIRENCSIGEGFQCGTKTLVMGELSIGVHVRTGSNVEIGQGSRIGSFVWLFINSSLLNDRYPPSEEIVGPTVEDFAIVGAHAVIFPGVLVGADSLVAANASLTRNLGRGMLAAGNPAKERGRLSDLIRNPDGSAAYPWRSRFQRGYPSDIVSAWAEGRSSWSDRDGEIDLGS